MNLRLDLEYFFFGCVGDYFFYLNSYRTACKDKLKTSVEKQNVYNYFREAKDALDATCTVIGLNPQKAIKLYRLFLHWSKCRKWERDFPIMAHYDAIVRYLIEE